MGVLINTLMCRRLESCKYDGFPHSFCVARRKNVRQRSVSTLCGPFGLIEAKSVCQESSYKLSPFCCCEVLH